MDSIDGTIVRVMFHKPSKWNPSGEPYLIARLSGGETVKGDLRRPVIGSPYRFYGEMKPQKGGYDEAFEFVSYEALCNRSVDGITDYLAAHVPGIGWVKAGALVETFGVDTLDVLRRDPERALEVSGITASQVEAIRLYFADTTNKFDPVAYSKLIDLFSEFRISKRTIEGLLRDFGSSAPDYVTTNPYLLLGYPRIGWKTSDSFALGKVEYDPQGIERHKAAITEAMERIAADGHTCATETELTNHADALLGGFVRPDALRALIDDGDIVETSDEFGLIYQLASLAHAEDTIADKLSILSASGMPLPFDLVTDEWVTDTGLGDDQADAVRMIEEHSVVIVSGAPGVGKSWTIARVLGRLRDNGVLSIRVVAPTGKAAKRAAQLLADVPGCEGIPSTTIHKALAPQPSTAAPGIPASQARFGRGRDEFSFGRSEVNPLEDQVVVVDEVSMVDVKLMASLLRSIKPGTRVIFVGDHNQLPSVGPGSVLRDMMAAGIPTAMLTEIRRSDGGGTVVRACHAIKDGFVPRDADSISLPTENWIHLEIDKPDEIAAKIVELHATTKKFDPTWDMQVVSPQKAKLPIGCDNLNRLLSRQLNPKAYGNPEIDDFFSLPRPASGSDDPDREPPFHVGDKIVRTKNGLADELTEFQGPDDRTGKAVADLRWRGKGWVAKQIPIVNGDMGQIRDIILNDHPSVIVEFRDPSRLCRLPLGECHIVPAYAMTVHKCQGSGFPYVVVPVHHSFYYDAKTGKGLFVRELLYTAISRAEQLLITVGQWTALVAAIGRKTVEKAEDDLSKEDRRTHESAPGRIEEPA